jgi:uncharacterized protein (DUF924 family)|tara:strand:- start:9971 stop:10513 length:543 start_codon:yes stop_codon:yes gene_type:complete
MVTPEDILAFWFQELEPRQWWAVDAALDTRIGERFLPTLEQAARCELAPWRASAAGRLAEVIVLDQFSRNIFRNTPGAFAQDPLALGLAQEAVAGGALARLEPDQRSFLLMPYMHSESRLIHEAAEPLFKAWAPANNHHFELRHKEIIDRFGRYPHRNAILGRESTAEEREFLTQPGSSF